MNNTEIDNNYVVYIHKNKINGKVYIGITGRKPEQRWLNGNGYKYNLYFNNAIRKYGWNNFEHIIVAENLSREQAETMEIELIQKYQSANHSKGYNIQLGGSYAGKHSDETKQKISSSHIGMRHTEETKKKLSDAFKGRKLTKEWIDKRTYSQTGLKRSSDTCRKISEGESVKVICINNRKVYPSLTVASKETGVNCSHISMCCNKQRKRAGSDDYGNKLYWMFYDEYLQNELFNKSNEEIMPTTKCTYKKVPIICIETGVKYSSIRKAHLDTGLSYTSLSQCVSGKYETCGGYHWSTCNGDVS